MALSAASKRSVKRTGAVKGHVRGHGVTDFRGCSLFLYNKHHAARLASHHPFADRHGRYVISHVPPGDWMLLCTPSPATPLAAMTYHQKPGLRGLRGTKIRVRPERVVDADFTLQPAGALMVFVVDSAGEPVAGAYVVSYEATSPAATVRPVVTDQYGSALLTNVPLRSKLLVVDSVHGAGAWWGGGRSWHKAKTLQLPGQRHTEPVLVALEAG